jgi:hypothetical protein
VLEQGETARGHNEKAGGEDSNHKRERRAARELTRTPKATTHENAQPYEDVTPRRGPRSSQSSGTALTGSPNAATKPETSGEEKEEEEADTQTEKEWGFPTRIQLQMRDGAMVNLHMNKVSQRYGHTRVR